MNDVNLLIVVLSEALRISTTSNVVVYITQENMMSPVCTLSRPEGICIQVHPDNTYYFVRYTPVYIIPAGDLEAPHHE